MENIFLVKIQTNVNQRKHINHNVMSEVSHTIKIQNLDHHLLYKGAVINYWGGRAGKLWGRAVFFWAPIWGGP